MCVEWMNEYNDEKKISQYAVQPINYVTDQVIYPSISVCPLVYLWHSKEL